jgi:uncharacterized protein YggE
MSATQNLDTEHRRTNTEGVTVIGEAVRTVSPEHAEFLIEITANATTAAQALRDSQMKTVQVTQAISALGVKPGDIQTISLNVFNAWSPVMPAFGVYGGVPQIGQPGFPAFGAAGQPELQFGSYQSKNTLRVSVRDSARVGEIVDTAARAGASAVSPFSFKAPDEASARRAALEAAGKDARAKAQALAEAAGRKIGDAIAISEDVVASNGAYAALRSAFPFSFGAGAPQTTGELEYYARVSASFRFQ